MPGPSRLNANAWNAMQRRNSANRLSSQQMQQIQQRMTASMRQGAPALAGGADLGGMEDIQVAMATALGSQPAAKAPQPNFFQRIAQKIANAANPQKFIPPDFVVFQPRGPGEGRVPLPRPNDVVAPPEDVKPRLPEGDGIA